MEREPWPFFAQSLTLARSCVPRSESENFNFPFFYEKKPNRGSEMLKIKLQKILGNLLNELRNLYMNGTVI